MAERERWDRNSLQGLAASHHYFQVTPSDSVDFVDGLTREIYCADAGNVNVVRNDNAVVPFEFLAGVKLGISCKRINATGTVPLKIYVLF